MAAKRSVRYTCTIRRFFGRREVLEAIDEFNDLQYLASTKVSSSALVGGRSCTCVFYCTSLESFCFAEKLCRLFFIFF